MSELRVDTIKKADGTGSLSVPAESGTVVTTASPSLGRRNLIINGAMQVAQRGTSSSTHNSFVTDRFEVYGNSTSLVFTASQVTGSPDNFKNSLKYTVDTAATAADGTERIEYNVEGLDAAQLNLGTSAAQSFTFSFYVNSSVTGTYAVAFQNKATDRHYIAEYTINSANTWERKTITLTGDTSGTWSVDNTTGLKIRFALNSNASFQSSTGSWQTGNKYTTSNVVNFTQTLNAQFYLTGVQLEVGSVATPFEHRSYTDEYLACSRYYQRLGEIAGGASAQYEVLPAVRWGLNTLFTTVATPVTMRANPTPDGPAGNIGDVFGNGSTDSFTVANVNVQSITNRGVVITIGIDFNPTGTYAYVLYTNDNAYLELDAEL